MNGSTGINSTVRSTISLPVERSTGELPLMSFTDLMRNLAPPIGVLLHFLPRLLVIVPRLLILLPQRVRHTLSNFLQLAPMLSGLVILRPVEGLSGCCFGDILVFVRWPPSDP